MRNYKIDSETYVCATDLIIWLQDAMIRNSYNPTYQKHIEEIVKALARMGGQKD